jgi:hypothetical protein
MQGERTEVRELRLRYSVEGMARLIGLLDHMKLGELPEEYPTGERARNLGLPYGTLRRRDGLAIQNETGCGGSTRP